MNTKTITSDLGKDVVRVIGELFSEQEKDFLLHYENIGERVFASKDRLASMFYLHARQSMNDIVGYHLAQVLNLELASAHEKHSAYCHSATFEYTVNQFRSHISGLGQRMRDIKLL